MLPKSPIAWPKNELIAETDIRPPAPPAPPELREETLGEPSEVLAWGFAAAMLVVVVLMVFAAFNMLPRG